MVARTRRTNSAARSTHAGEPSVRAPDDRVLASTSRRHAKSAFSSRVPASQNFRGCWRTSLTWSLASQPNRA
ncbi:hypothetical protein AXF42_Ash019518 [Apostasia shenzhenica]|uniref:Uncharacterized protein n=1 Tax=Apostasia shenzhenica TaxID=1088818 RepID=A0A2I0A0A4_9ASPA|nr:hypothetical protein AXF42_Ash019518 [Apostasia shenzhenica]